MRSVQTFRMPDAGEGLTEAEIVRWLVAPGDVVRVNDVLVEIETAKSLVELPSPYAGTVVELLAAAGATVDVGAPIITVSAGASSGAAALPGVGPDATAVTVAPADVPVEPGLIGGPAPGGRTSVLVGYGPRTTTAVRRPRRANVDSLAENPVKPQRHGGFEVGRIVEQRLAEEAEAPHPAPHRRPHVPVAPADAGAPAAGGERARVLAKPPVRKLARELGVDLHGLVATGPLGTVSREDVLRAGAAATPLPSSEPGGAARSRTGARETRVPVKGVRKATAQAMVESAFTAPHVTEFVTVDVTRTMRLVRRLRDDPAMTGVKVSPLLLVAKALLVAVRRNPGVNASWDEAAGEIVVKHYVNLGIAAATPRGLVVPNVKDADSLDLRELAEALQTLTTTAREGRTPPADLADGTLTITNVGVFGVDTGTPILPPGQAAILALGSIGPRPWVRKGKVVAREVTTLALGFDHRMVDGDLGSRFLADVAALLERPERALLWA